MNTKIILHIDTLVSAVLCTKNFDELSQYITENLQDVTDALQTIGDFDLENTLDAAIYALWKVCPSELDEHVEGAGNFFKDLIGKAWEDFDKDVSEAITSLLEIDTEETSEDISHLENCLSL